MSGQGAKYLSEHGDEARPALVAEMGRGLLDRRAAGHALYDDLAACARHRPHREAFAFGLVQSCGFQEIWRAAPGDDENYVYAIAL